MRGTERNGWAQFKLRVICLMQGPLSGDGGNYQDRFKPGELLADAAAWAEAEGEVGEAGTVGGGVGESLRIEAEWFWPESLVGMHDPLAHEDDGAGRELVTA